MIPSHSSDTKTSVWPIAAGIVAVAAVMAFFFWPRTPVELGDQGYELTMALYRVCNQQSVEGLAKVEQLVAESESRLSVSSREVLDSIIAQAKSGQWKEAAAECRQALEDQVRR